MPPSPPPPPPPHRESAILRSPRDGARLAGFIAYAEDATKISTVDRPQRRTERCGGSGGTRPGARAVAPVRTPRRTPGRQADAEQRRDDPRIASSQPAPRHDLDRRRGRLLSVPVKLWRGPLRGNRESGESATGAAAAALGARGGAGLDVREPIEIRPALRRPPDSKASWSRA